MNVFADSRAAMFAAGLRDDPARREALVKRMAADLVAAKAFCSVADAIRLLMWKGYRSVDIALLADDARQVAMQSVVAKEMMQP